MLAMTSGTRSSGAGLYGVLLQSQLVFQLFLCSVLAELKSSCVMPSVPEDATTTLTCHFSEDMVAVKSDVLVQYYAINETAPEYLLDCLWDASKGDDGDYKCTTEDTRFQFDGKISKTLTLTLTSAGPRMEGRYDCVVLTTAPSDATSCFFSLGAASTEDEEDSPYHVGGFHVGGVVACIFIPVALAIAGIVSCVKRDNLREQLFTSYDPNRQVVVSVDSPQNGLHGDQATEPMCPDKQPSDSTP